jgi:hypothetical protein
MADQSSHAATGDRKTFSVEIVSGPEAGTVLASGFGEFHDAIDHAIDWLDAEDAAGRERASVAVLAADRTRVWSYPPVSAGSAARDAGPKPLVALYGFDPVAWKPTTFGAPRAPRTPTEPRHVPPAVPAQLLAAAVDVHLDGHDDDSFDEPEAAPRHAPLGRAEPWLRTLWAETLALWNDGVGRVALVVGAVSAWLALTLLEPAFLATLACAAAAVAFRRRHGATAPGPDVDDWF